MRRFGYSEVLASGVVAVGSTLDILIPPSVAMVVYGILTGQSIGKLLIAGIVPGIVLGILLAISIIIWVTVSPSSAPKTQWVSWGNAGEPISHLAKLFDDSPCDGDTLHRCRHSDRSWCLWLCCGINYRCSHAPSHLGWRYRGIEGDRKNLVHDFHDSYRRYDLWILHDPERSAAEGIAAVTAMDINRWLVIIGIIVAYFVVSMFMDEIPLMLITVQLAFPLVVALKFRPNLVRCPVNVDGDYGACFPACGDDRLYRERNGECRSGEGL